MSLQYNKLLDNRIITCKLAKIYQNPYKGQNTTLESSVSYRQRYRCVSFESGQNMGEFLFCHFIAFQLGLYTIICLKKIEHCMINKMSITGSRNQDFYVNFAFDIENFSLISCRLNNIILS